MDTQLIAAVSEGTDRPEIVSAVAELYRRVADKIEIHRPRCDASGECCRFDTYGHRLYVTTIELIAFANQLADVPQRTSTNLLPILSDNGGACVFQVDGLCGVHPIRPFGCRMFYCDPTATEWQNEAYERFHADLKSLHEQFSVPYLYVEWRWAVATLKLNGQPTGLPQAGVCLRP